MKNNKKQINIHVEKFSIHTRPEIIESKREEYIAYGEDNNYFQFLIDLYINSTTNNSIINGISKIIFGKGIDVKNADRHAEDYARFKIMLSDKDTKNLIMDRKLLGMASMQVSYKNGKISKLTHFPMNTLRAEKCDEEGNIRAYYYHPDWVNAKPSDEPMRIPTFGFGNNKGNEIYIIKPYVPGYFYYTPVDYAGALDYALLESEISEYLINDTMNGFSGTKVVNFNNGVPDEEKQNLIKGKVLEKLTGSRGNKVIIAFNDNQESKTTVDDIPLNDAPAHYEYLSNECSNKMIVGHRVTSPLLIGVRTENNGLGSNADEIESAYKLFMNITIKPYQDEMVDALNEILAFNGMVLDLYFKPLIPLDFEDVQELLDAGVDEEVIEEETGVEVEETNLSKEDKDSLYKWIKNKFKK